MELQVGAQALATAVVASAAAVAVHRRLARQSSGLAALVAVGILIRAFAGVTVFWTSYLDLPVAASLHSGDGFWELAPDARSYFHAAAQATRYGLTTVSSGDPSPAFVRTLAGWMMLVGVAPASAILLNVLLYVAACFSIAALGLRQGVPRRWLIAPIAGLTFSPALLVFGTQPLKDVMFASLIVFAGVGWQLVWAGDLQARKLATSRFATGLIIVLSSTYLIAGIRAYFAVLIWMCAVVTISVATWTVPRGAMRGFLIKAGAVLASMWFVFWLGAGPYYASYSPARLWPGGGFSQPVSPTAPIDQAREGFVRAGGATNVATNDDSKVEAAAKGLAALFVPISVLKLFSIVEFNGGRGLLTLTDLDTVVTDIVILMGAAAVWSRRHHLCRQNVAPLVFAALLGCITTLLLAYVVTNYGTLFRLRLMATVPLWMLPVVVFREEADTHAPPSHIGSIGSGGWTPTISAG